MPPAFDRRPVSSIPPYAAMESSSIVVSPVPQPRRQSVGECLRPTWGQTLRVPWLQAPLQRPHQYPAPPERTAVVCLAPYPLLVVPRMDMRMSSIPRRHRRAGGHEHRAECLFSLLKPSLGVFRGMRKVHLPGGMGFVQCLRNLRQRNAFAPAAVILQTA